MIRIAKIHLWSAIQSSRDRRRCRCGRRSCWSIFRRSLAVMFRATASPCLPRTGNSSGVLATSRWRRIRTESTRATQATSSSATATATGSTSWCCSVTARSPHTWSVRTWRWVVAAAFVLRRKASSSHCPRTTSTFLSTTLCTSPNSPWQSMEQTTYRSLHRVSV